MRSIVTISIPTPLKEKVDTLAEQTVMTRSQILQRALESFLIDSEMNALRASLLPDAQQRELFTDEDVFKTVS